MESTARDERLLSLARVAMEIADMEEESLEKVRALLDDGKDAEALEEMRNFYRRHRKPPNRETTSYDMEKKKLAARA